MLVHVAGLLNIIGVAIIVTITYNFDPSFKSQIAFLLGAFSLMCGAAGWAIKESESEKEPVALHTRLLWACLGMLILGFGALPYVQAWGQELYVSQQIFLILVVPIAIFLIWVPAKQAEGE
jgi:FtsH-binding integral membrane protein